VANLEQMLDTLAGIDGVEVAVIASRDGLVIAERHTQENDLAEALGATSASLLNNIEALASDLGRGSVTQAIVELAEGLAVLQPAGPVAVLTVVVGSSVNLGRVRLALRKHEALVQQAVADL